MMMFKPRIALIGALTLLLISGVSASTASALGPYWHVNEERLNSGSKSLKLQSKGPISLQAQLGDFTTIAVQCANSYTEGADIEGNGAGQGQGKVRLVLTQCTSNWPSTCRIVEPVRTSQLKMHLVTQEGGQSKYAILYEPTQGTLFLSYRLGNGSETKTCVIAGEEPIGGTVAAEIMPAEVERQEVLSYFPAEPISRVLREGEPVEVGLQYGSNQLKFAGSYGARLGGGEKFGIFNK